MSIPVDKMELLAEFDWFLNAVLQDSRIGPAHISLFMAILKQWIKNECQNPVCIHPVELMQQSKISGRNTYYRNLKELNRYGYIQYNPSHNSLIGSAIRLKLISHE